MTAFALKEVLVDRKSLKFLIRLRNLAIQMLVNKLKQFWINIAQLKIELADIVLQKNSFAVQIEGLIDWLIDWFFWLIDWLIDWLIM